ncbi:MAG: pyruvate kinase [Planctomycetia bacterium]|nr:pyruvate kinase [Planctomycetia bacterium]
MMSTLSVFPKNKPCRTKIIATIGPASSSEETMRELILAGVDLFRLNFAHSGPEKLQPLVDQIRRISAELQQPIGILADLAGPKIRLGEIPGGEFRCLTGTIVHFVRGSSTESPDVFTTTYPVLIDELNEGDRILLADGTVSLQVVRKFPDSADCQVIQGGLVRSRQGVNLPGVALSIKTLQPKDIENARWAVEAGIDFLGLSFVRSPEDIHELRALLASAAEKKIGKDQWNLLSEGDRKIHFPNIIAKIEKPEVLEQLDAIIEAADGIMVARGDLGVEVDIAKIAVVQKKIISTCTRMNKPVIVATQMLESMTEESMPTRAEATDVANAILDGTDAVMLSGESAVGAHPILVVQTMNRIARETENALLNGPKCDLPGLSASRHIMIDQNLPESVRVSIAVCDAAGSLAETINASMICVATRTGRTALNFSKMRNRVMTVGTSVYDEVLRRLCLYWGVIPVGGIDTDPKGMLTAFVDLAKKADYLKKDDRVVLTAGIGTIAEERNVVYVHTVH